MQCHLVNQVKTISHHKMENPEVENNNSYQYILAVMVTIFIVGFLSVYHTIKADQDKVILWNFQFQLTSCRREVDF